MVGTSSALRVVFFGTPAFAVPTLRDLLASRHHVCGVVTQPDRPRGRGHAVTDAPVKALARARALPLLQPTRLREPAIADVVASWDPDIGVVAAYGRLIPEALLAVPRLGMVNVHASLLPKYRGAAPIQRAILAGETETGVTIMRMVAALDAGPMLAAVRHPLAGDETSVDVEQALAELGATLLVKSLDAIAEGPVPEVAQDETGATYAAKITREDGLIDWSGSARALHDQIRGLYPWPRAFTFLDGQRLIVLASSPGGCAVPGDAAPGTVVIATRDAIEVATGSGLLSMTRVQPEGRKPMAIREFLAGHPVATGTVLCAPHGSAPRVDADRQALTPLDPPDSV